MQHMALLHLSVSYKDTDSQHLWRNVGIWKSALQKNHLGLVYTMHKSAMIIVMEYKLKEQKKKKKSEFFRIPPLVDFMPLKPKT